MNCHPCTESVSNTTSRRATCMELESKRALALHCIIALHYTHAWPPQFFMLMHFGGKKFPIMRHTRIQWVFTFGTWCSCRMWPWPWIWVRDDLNALQAAIRTASSLLHRPHFTLEGREHSLMTSDFLLPPFVCILS